MDKINVEELLERVKILEQRNKELERSKKYGLVWEDTKEELDLKPVIPMLKKEESMNVGNIDEEPRNYLIEGDNYHALKVLQHTHKNKVDVIYIDPPYNTGNEFVYNDKIVDKEDNFRHSKWLSFMDKRLRLAKNLMTDDGVIFVSIDDNEQAQLKLLMDSIFGENNHINTVSVQSNPGGNKSKYIETSLHYGLVYAKNKTALDKIGRMKPVDIPKNAKRDSEGYYTKGYQLEKWGNDATTVTHPRLAYSIYFREEDKDVKIEYDYNLEEIEENRYLPVVYSDKIKEEYEKNGYHCIRPRKPSSDTFGRWRVSSETFLTRLKGNQILFEKNKDGIMKVYEKKRIKPLKFVPMKDFIDSKIGIQKNDLNDMFGDIKFSYPKTVKFISYLLENFTKKDSLVMDFFAGSGTTGHAVLELNEEDGGNRSFILCTNNEVSEEKIRQHFVDKGLLDKNNKTAFNKFKEENPELVEEFYESDKYKQLGIARSVTRERIKRVSEGYTTPKGVKVEGLGGNLEYFVTEEFSEEDVYGFKRNQLAELALNSHSIRYPTNKFLNILVGTFTNLDEIELDKTKKPTFLINARDNETLSKRMEEITKKYGNDTVIHSIEDYYDEF